MIIPTKDQYRLLGSKYLVKLSHCINLLTVNFFFNKQKLPEDLPALPQVKYHTLDHSHDMPIQKIAVNIISASKVPPVNTVAQSEPFSKLVILMALVTVKIQKMFPDGKLI